MVFLFSKQSKIKNTYPLIISILITQVIQIRPYLFGNFYGDPFDGRLQIVLHEHWFKFFSGLTSLRNTNFFYPYPYGLGLSDPFVIQGFLHSIFRSANFDIIESWALSNIAMIFIGNIGLALIAHVSFKTNAIKFFFVLINGISYTYVAHIYLHPNITGFALIPYIFYFAINSKLKIQNKISLIYITLALLSLTSWYGFIFTVFFGIVYLILNFRKLKLLDLIKAFTSKVFIFSNFIAIPIFLLFIYIHLPVLDEVTRTKEEMILNSPNLNNILNGSQLGGGLFNFTYKYLGLTPNLYFKEYEIGISISMMAIFIISFIILTFKRRVSQLLILWVTNTIILALFFSINNISIFSFFWDFIPVASSIRIPIRYLIVFVVINVFIFLALLDKFNLNNINNKNNKNNNKYFIILVLLTITTFDQLRFETAKFEKKNYTSDKKIEKTLLSNKSCKAFYLDSEGLEWWNDQLEAMIISSSTGIPTVNGYSGGFPANYPNQDWRSRADLGNVGKWLIKNNALSGTCLLRRNYANLFNESPVTNIISGFDLTESNDRNTWNWSIDDTSEIKIFNFQKNKIIKNLEFTLKLPTCLDEKSVEIYFDDQFIAIINLNQISKTYTYEKEIRIMPESELSIKFKTDTNFCSVPNDLRSLNFNLLNIRFI